MPDNNNNVKKAKIKPVKVDRKQHLLSPTKNTSIPKKILFIDTESSIIYQNVDEQKHVFKLGCMIMYKFDNKRNEYVEDFRYHTFDLNIFWKTIVNHVKKNESLYIFAHNLHYDFNITQAMKYMQMHKYKLKTIIVDSNRFIARFVNNKDQKHIYFIDSTNFLMIPLEKIGKIYGIQKMKIDFENCSNEELITYCYRDVEILAKFITDFIMFIKREDLGKFKFTIASQALSAFKHRFMPCPLECHVNEDAIQLEIASYKGGISDIFYKGKFNGNFYKVDVNSMYPYVMKNFKYPVKLEKFMKNISLQEFQYILKNYELFIIDALVEVKNGWIPSKLNVNNVNKLCRVKGKFRTVITSAELKFYMDLGYIELKKIYAIACYKSEYIFKDYIDYFYNKKEEASKNNNEIDKMKYKLFLNSLYGKFAQKVRNISIIENDKDSNIMGNIRYVDINGERHNYWIVNNYIIEEDNENILGYDTIPAISSFVTAYARIYLHKLIIDADENNVYYVDTDSIITNEAGFQNLVKKGYIDDYELGKLKLEQIGNELVLNKPKDYALDNVVKKKGIRKDAKEIGKNIFEQYQFMKTRSLWKKGILDGVIVKKIQKQINDFYDKGHVNDENSKVVVYDINDENLL